MCVRRLLSQDKISSSLNVQPTLLLPQTMGSCKNFFPIVDIFFFFFLVFVFVLFFLAAFFFFLNLYFSYPHSLLPKLMELQHSYTFVKPFQPNHRDNKPCDEKVRVKVDEVIHDAVVIKAMQLAEDWLLQENATCLIHGDLHSGSVLGKSAGQDIKVSENADQYNKKRQYFFFFFFFFFFFWLF